MNYYWPPLIAQKQDLLFQLESRFYYCADSLEKANENWFMSEKHALVNELRRLITVVKTNDKSQKRRINKTSTFLMLKKFKFKTTVQNKSLQIKISQILSKKL
jgi:hypothetical protein